MRLIALCTAALLGLALGDLEPLASGQLLFRAKHDAMGVVLETDHEAGLSECDPQTFALSDRKLFQSVVRADDLSRGRTHLAGGRRRFVRSMPGMLGMRLLGRDRRRRLRGCLRRRLGAVGMRTLPPHGANLPDAVALR